MFLSKLYVKFLNRLSKLTLRPIRVYCLHHVCKQYKPNFMYKDDWVGIDDFKNKINNLREKGVIFISLTSALDLIKKDIFRLKKYAVITFDDGYKSLDEILPWLEENKNRVHQMGPIDDLTFIARRGRISKGKAFMGNLAGIKPMGDCNEEGYATVLAKAKGMKKACLFRNLS